MRQPLQRQRNLLLLYAVRSPNAQYRELLPGGFLPLPPGLLQKTCAKRVLDDEIGIAPAVQTYQRPLRWLQHHWHGQSRQVAEPPTLG